MTPASRNPKSKNGDATWWLDPYFTLFQGHPLVASISLAVITYVLGLALALGIGFGAQYINTRPIYLGVLGIAWTGAFAGWGRKRIVEVLSEIRPAFKPSAARYTEAASRGQRLMLDWRPQIALALLTFLASCTYVWIVTGAQEFPWFPASWSSSGSELWVKNIILFLFAAPILALSASALAFIWFFTSFSLGLRKLEVIPLLGATLALLRPLAEFGVALSVGWSGGVSLFILFFRLRPTSLSVALVTGLSGVAFMILFSPQYAIHRILLRTKRALLEAASLKLAGDVKQGTKSLATFLGRVSGKQDQELIEFTEGVLQSRTWVYSYSGLLPLLTPVGLPAGVFALRAILGR